MSSYTLPKLTRLETALFDHLTRRAPATDDLPELATWLQANGASHLSSIERIELAERLITRRRFLIGAGALVLAGCGAGEQASAPTAAVASADYPRTVKHLGGEATFERRPERVISEGNFSEFDNLLALGIPVLVRGSGKFEISDPKEDLTSWQLAAGGEQVPVDRAVYGGQANLEELVRLQPDVYFITQANFSSAQDESYTRRNQIVPLIVVPDGIEGIRVVADVFAVPSERVEALIAEANAKMAGFTPPRIPTSITVFFFFDDGNFYIASAQHPANELLLQPFGLPTFQKQGDAGFPPFATISTELALELDADLVLAAYDGNFATALDTLEQQPLFQSIPAVREGRYQRMSPDFTVAFNRPTVLSIDAVIAGFNEVLSE